MGYADLHFVTRNGRKIDFGKGTYYASKGILQRQDTPSKLKKLEKSSMHRGWSV
jgi:hypothetical protein